MSGMSAKGRLYRQTLSFRLPSIDDFLDFFYCPDTLVRR